jgi:hypothetical protein
MEMNCPECFRYSEGGWLCKRCINEKMNAMQSEYREWLQQIEILPAEGE